MEAKPNAIAIASLLNQICDESPDWQTGDNLTFLTVSEGAFRHLGELVIKERRDGLSSFGLGRQTQWGAAMFLVGAQAFHRSDVGPFTYERIWRMFELVGAGQFVKLEYDALEYGARSFWGISLLRDRRGHRQFQGTMLFHSGGGWLVLEAACEQVRRSWSWEGVRQAGLDDIAEWLEAQLRQGRFPEGPARALENEDGRYGTAPRLQQIAEARERIIRRGWVHDDPAKILSTLREANVSLRELFVAPSEDAAVRLLPMLFSIGPQHAEERPGSLAWHWSISQSRMPRLMIALPDHVRLPEAPLEVERCQLHLLGAQAAEGAIFERTNGHFSHSRGPRQLSLPASPIFPNDVVATFHQVDQTREMLVQRMDFPGEPVATFITESGNLVTSAPPDTRVVLLCAPGYSFTRSPGFTRLSIEGLEAWMGRVPDEPVSFDLTAGDTLEPWLMSPSTRRIALDLEGAEVPGLRFGLNRAFSRWPSVWVEETVRSGRYRLTGPEGLDLEKPFRTRGSRLGITSGELRPGLYRLSVENERRRGSIGFVLLPPTMLLQSESTPLGTTVQAIGATLRRLDGPESGQDHVTLPPDVRGPVTFSVAITTASAPLPEGRWTVLACPPDVRLVRREGGPAIEGAGDLGLLRGSGGIEIAGKPGSSASVTFRPARWDLRLNAEGRRFFPCSDLPAEILRESDKILWIDVQLGAQPSRRLGPFMNESAQRPSPRLSWTSDGRCRISIRLRSAVDGPVHLEAVTPAELWAPPWVSPCERRPLRKGVCYDAILPGTPGSYIVALMRGEQRISGMASVLRPVSGTALPELDDEPWGEDTPGSSNPAPGSPILGGSRGMPPSEVTLDGPLTSPTADIMPRSSSPRTRRTVQGGIERTSSREESSTIFNAVYARSKAALEAADEGEAWIERIVPVLRRYGTRWFHEATALVELATFHRLKALLEPADEVKAAQLLEVFREAGVSWSATRYGDFDLLTPMLFSLPGQALARWLHRLADERAGLLIPAWIAWQKHPDLDSVWEKLAPWIAPWNEVFAPALPLLTSEQVELLRTPQLDEDTPRPALSLRLKALLETRERTAVSEELSLLLRQFSEKDQLQVKQWRAERSIPAVQNGIPPQLRELEELVTVYAYRVHRWRQGETQSTRVLKEVRVIWRELPGLMDFWLNRWAATRQKERS